MISKIKDAKLFYKTIFLFAFAFLMPTHALAREYYYFNKPGVSREDFKKDRQDCEALASGVRKQNNLSYVPPNPNLTVGQNAAAAGIAALFSGMINAGERRRTMSMVERICMADKGYERYEVQPVIVRDIEKLPSKEEQLDRHFEMAAAIEPMGKRIVE